MRRKRNMRQRHDRPDLEIQCASMSFFSVPKRVGHTEAMKGKKVPDIIIQGVRHFVYPNP